jgi:hypothetical protein
LNKTKTETMLPRLNLPPISNETKIINGKQHIYDAIRKQWLVLTPEEWVRQHVIAYLVYHKNYPVGLLKTEAASVFNGKNKRSDIVCYTKDLQPYLLIECKASTVSINEKTIAQLATYQSNFKATILGLSNGIEHYFFTITTTGIEFLEDIPTYTP